jgi:hypothetical protein
MLFRCPPERMGECKATVEAVVFSLRVNELILDLLGSLNNFFVSPFRFSAPGYSVKGPINSTR